MCSLILFHLYRTAFIQRNTFFGLSFDICLLLFFDISWYLLLLSSSTERYICCRYLERKEFLERADVRQFEIERAMRMGKRSNRWRKYASVTQHSLALHFNLSKGEGEVFNVIQFCHPVSGYWFLKNIQSQEIYHLYLCNLLSAIDWRNQ